MSKARSLNQFYDFCLTTCGERRLKKIKIILSNTQNIIGKDLTKLNKQDVVKFLVHINQSDFKSWTKNDYKKIFKRFLKWYYQDLEMVEGKEVKQGFKGVSGLKARNRDKLNKDNLIKPEELEKLLRTANSLKWKALISLLYESAFRPCEIRLLKWKDITFDDSNNLARIFTISPKTKEDRKIPVRECIVHLKRWKEEYQFKDRREDDFVFPSQQARDKPLGDGTITEMFKRLSKQGKMRNIYPYLLRHSRIYEIQKRLGDARLSSKFGGHSLETSELYDHLDSDDVEESMLKEIYTTKEISKEKKHELELEIEKLKEWVEHLFNLQEKNITRLENKILAHKKQ